MGKASRNKGKNGELEVIKILNDELGLNLKRNLEQYQESDGDIHIHSFCLEVKRCEQLSLGSWWGQACTAANVAGEIPAVVYRQSRQPWRVMMPFYAISDMFANYDEETNRIVYPDWAHDFERTITMLLAPAFTDVLREHWMDDEIGNRIEKEIKGEYTH